MTIFLNVIKNSSSITSHKELFDWLHDDIQTFIPHDILLTAWGDFSLGLMHLDIVSYLPGIRTEEVSKQLMLTPLQELFEQWVASERKPFTLSLNEQSPLVRVSHLNCAFGNAFALMRSALVHGIKDERGRHDCLYVALSANRTVNDHADGAIRILLPYVDAALRQVAHLPMQYPDFPEDKPDIEQNNTGADGTMSGGVIPWNLSRRELQIMQWVCMGKTNAEIAQILDISFFTVKNHLQRIFRKMDVLNRTQAVAKSERLVKQLASGASATVK